MSMIAKQKGVTTVEFAIIGMLFFIILFGIVEVGRALFVWNGLADITRRAARIGAVCPPNDVSVIRTAIYNAADDGGTSSIITGLAPSHVTLLYLDSTMTDLPNPATTDFSSVKYVQASINNTYTHQMLIPTFNINLTPPSFSTTVPAESLGRWKDVDGNVYNGCYLP
jgi:Flp pilus assembly protein TadG